MLSALALMLAQPVAEVPPELQPIPSLDAATEQVEALDAKLFWAAFEGCDAEPLRDILAEDFRMLHDLGGLAVPSRDDFITGVAQQCADREPGGANPGYKNRRLLVPGSRTVTPLGDWGLLERAHHTFHEWRGDEDRWEQVGGARYIHVWQWIAEEGRFRLAESLSIDHGPAVQYPPEGSNQD